MVRHTIVSGLPAGWAAWDHSRNNGLRTNRISCPAGVRDPVRPGAGHRARAGLAVRRPGRDRRRVGILGQLEQELGVGRGEVEGDRPGGVVGDDPAGQVAATRMIGARGGAGEAGVQRPARRSDPEQALDRAAEVAGPQRLAVGVPDAGTDPEGVRRAVVGRRRDGQREVGDDPQPVRAGAALEGDEVVVGQPAELRVEGIVEERRVDRGAGHRGGRVQGGRGRDRERPAAMATAAPPPRPPTAAPVRP